MGEKIKAEDRAMVTTSDLVKMKQEMREQLLETEIVPLKEKLEIALETVQLKAVVKPDFVAPTKEQVMGWIAPGCKDTKILTLFIATCEHLQLDPIKKEIYLYDQGSNQWVIKVDYKVPIAIAQRDMDYLHFKSWVEYLPGKVSDKFNPQSIKGAWCRIYKRSWVKLSVQANNPELAYKEHFVPWDTWRRVTKGHNLFQTWDEKGHFYIEKTAIDHCFRLVYSELCGGLPASIGHDIIEEEQQTIEATLLQNHTKKESAKALGAGQIDRDFSEAPGEEQTREPKSEDGFVSASIPQVTAIGNLVKALRKAKMAKEKVSEAENALADHETAILSSDNGMSHEYAAQLIKELQDAAGVKK